MIYDNKICFGNLVAIPIAHYIAWAWLLGGIVALSSGEDILELTALVLI